MTPHIYIIAYNEQFILPFTINHYRERFPNCPITIYDNESTDNTVAIALDYNCEVRTYKTNNELNDLKYLEIKNGCWKGQKEKWAIVIDADELLDIAAPQLLFMDSQGYTIIQGRGYNMVNLVENNLELDSIKYGVRAESYDKYFAFNTELIHEINYGAGCHNAAPMGTVKIAQAPCYHYKYIEKEYMVKRHAHFASRLSKINKARDWGGHYLYTAEQIRNEFQDARNKAVKVRV